MWDALQDSVGWSVFRSYLPSEGLICRLRRQKPTEVMASTSQALGESSESTPQPAATQSQPIPHPGLPASLTPTPLTQEHLNHLDQAIEIDVCLSRLLRHPTSQFPNHFPHTFRETMIETRHTGPRCEC